MDGASTRPQEAGSRGLEGESGPRARLLDEHARDKYAAAIMALIKATLVANARPRVSPSRARRAGSASLWSEELLATVHLWPGGPATGASFEAAMT